MIHKLIITVPYDDLIFPVSEKLGDVRVCEIIQTSTGM